MKKLIVPALAAAGLMAVTAGCGKKAPQLGHAPLDDVVAAMTLEEKVHLIVGNGMGGNDSGDSAVVGLTKKIVPGAAGTTYPIERLGIPAIVLADGPAGLRISPTRDDDTATYYCTYFPIATLLASTWDTGLVEQVGQAMGNEVLEYGVDVLLAPGMNIHRNPLCGRNYEYYSEDPLVTGAIASAFVNGVQSNGVGVSVKHFAANNQETNRVSADSRVGQRALREIYLKGFEKVVKEASPWTLMTSYNYLNGYFTSENPELTDSLLRGEWGYEGMVVSDWHGGKDAVAQMKAGNEMLQPGKKREFDSIIAAVKDGRLDEKRIDRNVKYILGLIEKTPHFRGYAFSNAPDLAAHAEVTRQSATEGMVLLKNDRGALPLENAKNIALYGSTSYAFVPGGTGSGSVNSAYTVSLLDGLRNAGYAVDPAIAEAYGKHMEAENERIAAIPRDWWAPVTLPEEMSLSPTDIAKSAATDDAAVITIGRTSGEFYDRASTNFNIRADELKMIRDISRAFRAQGKPVVVVLNVSGVIETASWRDYADAILCAWLPGQEGGNSVADIISGRVSPSGHLPMTFPIRFEDHASTTNFPVDQTGDVDINSGQKALRSGIKNVDYTNYDEDVYVGYRYFESFGKPVAYPFGYGLSYTTFDLSDAKVTEKDGKVTVEVKVTNTGDRPGKEVAQVYSSPTESRELNMPSRELRAFAKTRELKPGESEVLKMEFDRRDLAMFDAAIPAWVVKPGLYRIMVGTNVDNARAVGAIDVTEAMIERVKDILKPQHELNILKRK